LKAGQKPLDCIDPSNGAQARRRFVAGDGIEYQIQVGVVVHQWIGENNSGGEGGDIGESGQGAFMVDVAKVLKGKSSDSA
jgi:hypothetical protein